MVVYDGIMVAILVIGVVQGAWRGLAWQMAPIASLVLGYVVAYPMSSQLAPFFGDNAPTNRFVALLVLYCAVSLGVYLIARALRESIERFKMVEFDRHLGALFGAVKGVLVCLVVTFFAVALSESSRDYVLNSYTGVAAGHVIHQLEPVMPDQMEELLYPYLAAIHDPATHEPDREGIAKTPRGPASPAKSPDQSSAPSTAADDNRSATKPSPKKEPSPLPLFLEDVLRMVERMEQDQRR